MAAQWLLFYAMVAASLGAGGYALIKGAAEHRFAVAVLAGGAVVASALCRIASATGIARIDAAVPIDMIGNALMCICLIALALRYERANWIIGLMVLQAVQLGFDGFMFEEHRIRTQIEFPDVANVLTIFEMAGLAAATAMRRTKSLEVASLTRVRA